MYIPTAAQLINDLDLSPHPEGGYYKETYRAAGQINGDESFPGQRSYSTAIYFLLEGNSFSAFHRIKSDELWHFYEGGPLDIFVIDKAGALSVIRLGRNTAAGERYQAVVAAGCWFASEPADTGSYALVGCTVAPGFDFRDFEMAERKQLVAAYPQHAALISRLTRD